MSAAIFALAICPNGQPCISTNVRPFGGHVFYRNEGFDLAPKQYAGETLDGLLAQVKALAPDAKIRRLTRGSTPRVSVRFPAALVARRDAIAADWQSWAAAGLSHDEMRHRAINHPAYRAA